MVELLSPVEVATLSGVEVPPADHPVSRPTITDSRNDWPHQSISGAQVQDAKRMPAGQKVSPTASPISSGLDGSQRAWAGRKLLVLLDSPRGREGGNVSRNA